MVRLYSYGRRQRTAGELVCCRKFPTAGYECALGSSLRTLGHQPPRLLVLFLLSSGRPLPSNLSDRGARRIELFAIRRFAPQSLSRRTAASSPAALRDLLAWWQPPPQPTRAPQQPDRPMPLTRQVTRVVRRPQLVRQYCAAATGLKSMVKTYNAISPKGLMRYPEATWDVSPDHEDAHAIMLRSHGLKDEEVTESVRCIARCGAGVNNIPVDRMTERGIPVFNSPGANANAVKELVLCSLLLASRGIVQGVKHTQQMMEDEEDPAVIKKRVEAEKKLFGGQELAGKTLGVIGLGYIGASVAEAAAELGMKIVAYDPVMTVDAAWRLSGRHMERVLKLDDLLKASDYITLHVPYMTQTHHMLDMDALQTIKPTCHLVNFSRGELIDTAALTNLYQTGAYKGCYVADFPEKGLKDESRCIFMPHLGASTEEAEENSASMAADEVKDYIEHGIIRNSVNFPETALPPRGSAIRLAVVNKNESGVLGNLNSLIANHGLNIMASVNNSRGDIAYTVVDIDSGTNVDMEALTDEIFGVSGVISTRFLTGEPGRHFRTNSGNSH